MGTLVEDAVIEARRAHDALVRSRTYVLAQRDTLDAQLVRIGAAIEALQELLSAAPEPCSPPEGTSVPQQAPALEPARAPKSDTAASGPPASGPGPLANGASHTARMVNRKARVREIMLESPDDWFSAAEVASLVEGRVPSEARRTATYEMMRRMAKLGELELDNSAKPTKFRAHTAAIRERVLASEL
jgi:hypothetical protein